MDKTRLRAIKLVMFSLLAFGSTAPAQADGVYIGAGIYRADTDAGHDTTPSGFIGYNFLDTNFFMASVEAGYYDLGNTSNNNLKLDASAITAGGVLALPLGPIFEFYAKGGLAFLDAETKTSLLSHGDTPHYHRRCIVSLLSSGWGQVVPMLYGRQANWLAVVGLTPLRMPRLNK